LDVELKNLAVELSDLITPIEGIVTSVKSPYAGVNISPTQAEFEIINPRSIFFSANADQTEIINLTEKMLGNLTLDSFPDIPISGYIENISFTPKENETGTVYEIKFIFNDDFSSQKFRIGMAGDLSFVVDSKENIKYVENKYIKTEKEGQFKGKKYINIIKGDKISKEYIETGMETDNSTEIITDEAEGTAISD
jgi:hypothetical protein